MSISFSFEWTSKAILSDQSAILKINLQKYEFFNLENQRLLHC